MVRRGALVLALALVTALTGCNRADTQAPEVTLSQAAEALNQVSGYHVRWATPPSPQGQVVYDLSVRPPGAATGTITLGSAGTGVHTYPMRFDGQSLYAQGRSFAEVYYAQFGIPTAAVDQLIGDRWFKDRPAPPGGLLEMLTNPGEIGKCITGSHGALRIEPPPTGGGSPAVVIADPGNGQSLPSMEYEVASSGAPYPILIEQTGDAQSTAGNDPCHVEMGVTATFSDFGEPVSISLPTDPVDVSKL